MINTKKLNSFFMSDKNTPEMKNFVRDAVANYMSDNNATNMNTRNTEFLTDLGLLKSPKNPAQVNS